MGGERALHRLGQALARLRARIAGRPLGRLSVTRLRWERRFREVFVASPVGMALADQNGLFVEVNPAWCELLGRPPEALIGHPSTEFIHQEDLSQRAGTDDWPGPATAESSNRMASESARIASESAELRTDEGGVLWVERRWIRPDGELRCGWLSVAPVHGPHGQNWTLAHAQDLTERKRVESDLQQSQDTLTAVARVARCVQSGEDPRPVLAAEIRWLSGASSVSILEPTGAGLLTVTHGLGHHLAGVQAPARSGAVERIWLGGPPEFMDRAGEDDWGFGDLSAPLSTASSWWQSLSDNESIIGVLVVTWDCVVGGPGDPSVRSVRALAEEAASVFTAARVRLELETLADTDALTGLANRRGWQASLRDLTATARQSGCQLALALVDLDHFKLYNDAYGHHCGDVLLRNFSARAKDMLRNSDVIARWGGEEFAIGLPGCGALDAESLLDRLRAAVPDGQTCSIGYAILSPTETGADCLIRADSMLYRAKREGRNRVVGATDVGGPSQD